MTNPTITNNVEITCKTTCKTQCINIANLCAKFLLTTTHCVYPPHSHFLLTAISHAFTQLPTPGLKATFPLFHLAYYYNY